MNMNEKLTEAARRGAYGKTGTGAAAFNSLPPEDQQHILRYVMQRPQLLEEIVRQTLGAMSAEEVEELRKDMSEAGAFDPKDQSLHTGDQTTA